MVYGAQDKQHELLIEPRPWGPAPSFKIITIILGQKEGVCELGALKTESCNHQGKLTIFGKYGCEQSFYNC